MVPGSRQILRADAKKAIWQLINTFIPYVFLWAVMIYLVKHNYPYWSILLLSLLAAGFLVRVFIFFHDCGHNSLFKSPRANRITGYIFAGILGIWLFYVQHRFENVYWARHDQWDPIKAALEGSSYYKLPKILQWFSGNIGLHHIHHIRSNIPNYNLQACYDAIPVFQQVKPLKLFESLKCLGLKLYDEQQRKMVGFGGIKVV